VFRITVRINNIVILVFVMKIQRIFCEVNNAKGKGGVEVYFHHSGSGMEVSDWLHDPAALPQGKEPPVPIGQDAGWAPELV
jgi:hypothetical protein